MDQILVAMLLGVGCHGDAVARGHLNYLGVGWHDNLNFTVLTYHLRRAQVDLKLQCLFATLKRFFKTPQL